MILHLDGDGFFASCEQVMHPELAGKPIVTGSERGIITSASKEAKKLGIGRGVTPWDAKKIYPKLIFVSSNYRAYEVFSYRMVSIIKRYTNAVEHYSIDEAFADLSGLEFVHRMPLGEIAWHIKQEVQASMGLSFSFGLAPTKSLAKVASKWKKPDGFTVIAQGKHEQFLKDCPLEKIWGIGPRLNVRLRKMGLTTALDLARLSPVIVKAEFEKPLRIIWEELRGNQILSIESGEEEAQQSMQRTHTFRPTTDAKKIEQELLFNLEQVFRRLRDAGQVVHRVGIMLKSQEFRYSSADIPLERPTAYESEVIAKARTALRKLIRPDTLYRATGVFLHELENAHPGQTRLFESAAKRDKLEKLYASIDDLRSKFKRPVVRVGPVNLPTSHRSIIETLTPRSLMPVPPSSRIAARLKFL